MIRLIACLALILSLSTSADDFLVDRARKVVETLASESSAGRLTGSKEELEVATFLAAELDDLGATTIDSTGYLRPFEFTAGTRDVGTRLGWGDEQFDDPESVRGLSFSNSDEVSGPIVFAGYGISIPDSQDFGYDSYVGLDVSDKIVLVLRYFPEDASPEAKRILARYSGLRYKALTAREHGARAILVVTGPNSPNAGELAPMSFDTSISGSGIVAATVSGDLGINLFSKADMGLGEAQTALDTANPHVTGFELGDRELTISVKLEREKREGHNVVGVLPSEHPAGDKPWVVVGAHYDHLGRGEGGNSLAREDETGEVHFGADDNASGVAAVLEAARYLSSQSLNRHVIIGLWSGEELGVIGSSRFLADSPVPVEEIAAYINFDMVGRSQDNRLNLQAVGSSPAWPGLIERGNVVTGFDLNLNQDPYLPTDATPFYTKKVPTLNFFTGSHEDYHRPSDTVDKINYMGLVGAARLGALIVRRLALTDEPPLYAEVERSGGDVGGRDTLRAYTGTIPDYTTEVNGLRLSGVMAGGPAALAGITEGDVIIEFGGQTITNIYDYTYALDAVKIDVPVIVVLMRDGERVETRITPTARK